MEVMLLTKVENLGELGDIVKVRPGYARNYLIPYGKSLPATPENIAIVEKRKAELEAQMEREREQARNQAAQIDGKSIEFTVANVNEEGELPGSIGTTDIVREVRERFGMEIEKSRVRLPEGVFRKVGEYELTIHLHAGVDAQVKLKIIDKDRFGEAGAQNDGGGSSN